MRMGRRGERRGRGRLAPLVALVAGAALLTGCGSGSVTSFDSDGAADVRTEATAPAAPLAEPGGTADLSESNLPEANRAEVVTGSLGLQADDPIAVASRAVEIVEEADGRIDQRSDSPDVGGSSPTSSLTLRIPSDSFDDTVEELSGLGTVGYLTVDRTDVTADVADIGARVAALRASVDRLTRLIAEADNTAEVIEAEGELTERQQDLDAMLARQRSLDDQVDLSTLSLWISTEPVETGGGGFLDGLRDGWYALLASLGGLIIFVGAAIPWLILLALIALVIWPFLRLRRRRAHRRAGGDHAEMTGTATGAPVSPAVAPASSAVTAEPSVAPAPSAGTAGPSAGPAGPSVGTAEPSAVATSSTAADTARPSATEQPSVGTAATAGGAAAAGAAVGATAGDAVHGEADSAATDQIATEQIAPERTSTDPITETAPTGGLSAAAAAEQEAAEQDSVKQEPAGLDSAEQEAPGRDSAEQEAADADDEEFVEMGETGSSAYPFTPTGPDADPDSGSPKSY